jgi:hypothetical protein
MNSMLAFEYLFKDLYIKEITESSAAFTYVKNFLITPSAYGVDNNFIPPSGAERIFYLSV